MFKGIGKTSKFLKFSSDAEIQPKAKLLVVKLTALKRLRITTLSSQLLKETCTSPWNAS